MNGPADNHRPSAAALLPAAVIAAVVLLVALLVSGSQTGTIVVEKITFSATAIQNGQPNPPSRFSVTTISQTAADGTLQREFTANSFYLSGYQLVFTPQGGIQLYEPQDNTIFETTEGAVQRAITDQLKASVPPGTHVRTGVGRRQYLSARYALVPRRLSVFAQGLLEGEYRVAGRAMIDGRRALRLVETRAARRAFQRAGRALSTDETVYVTPVTYDPIEETIRTKFACAQSTATERWLVYRVLPATSENSRLLSLTALHPGAAISHDPRAYLRATQARVRPQRVRVGKGQTLAASASA